MRYLLGALISCALVACSAENSHGRSDAQSRSSAAADDQMNGAIRPSSAEDPCGGALTDDPVKELACQ